MRRAGRGMEHRAFVQELRALLPEAGRPGLAAGSGTVDAAWGQPEPAFDFIGALEEIFIEFSRTSKRSRI